MNRKPFLSFLTGFIIIVVPVLGIYFHFMNPEIKPDARFFWGSLFEDMSQEEKAMYWISFGCVLLVFFIGWFIYRREEKEK